MEKSILKEKAVHGTYDYPFAVYHWDGTTQSVVSLHWHQETEIIYLKRGIFSFTINMKEYVQEAPALIFVGSEEIHSIQIDMGNVESALVFDMGMLSFENYDGIQYKVIHPLLEGDTAFPQMILPEDRIWEEVLTIYESIFQHASNKELSSYLRVKAGLYQLLASLYENGYLKNTKGIRNTDSFRLDTLRRVLAYIRENYDKKLTIDEIAEIAGMNPQYFCRFFKHNTGKTVTEYVNDIRINKAAHRLLTSDDKVIDIAGGCGYDNMGYFIKRFRQCKGVAPSEYRKRNKEYNRSI